MAETMRQTGKGGPDQMGRHLGVARTPEELTPPAELAGGVLIYESYDTEEGTHILRGIASIAGAEVHFTDEAPIGVFDPNPQVLVPGFGGIKPGYKKFRHELALAGHRAVSYKPPRKQSRFAAWHPSHLFAPEKLTSKAGYAMVRRLSNQEGVEGVHVVGHSMGGPISAEIALHKPKQVRSVTLIGSAGLEDHDMWTMARRMPGFIFSELIPALPELHGEFNASAVAHIVEYGLRSPRLTRAEMKQVSKANVRPTVLLLGKLGIPVNALQMKDDHLFIEENVHEQSSHLVGRYIALEGNHLKPQLDPEETAHTVLDAQAA